MGGYSELAERSLRLFGRKWGRAWHLTRTLLTVDIYSKSFSNTALVPHSCFFPLLPYLHSCFPREGMGGKKKSCFKATDVTIGLFNLFQDGLGWVNPADRSWLRSTPRALPAGDGLQPSKQVLPFIPPRVLPRGGSARGKIYFLSDFIAFVGICCLLVTVQRRMVLFLWNTGYCGECFRRSFY